MPAIDYPSTLPGPNQVTSEPKVRARSSGLPGLEGYTAPERDYYGTLSVSFFFSRDQAAIFKAWWDANSGYWFNAVWPRLSQSLSVYRILGTPTLNHAYDGAYRVSARVELRGASLAVSKAAAGETWVPRDSGRNWFGVASSADGTKLVVSVNDGFIYTSTDSGVTWTARAPSSGWRHVASSADGVKLAAVSFSAGSSIYTSPDSGVTWVATSAPTGQRYGVASSADGTKLVATQPGGQIHTSTDSGVTWTARNSARNWFGVASSADGLKLVACVNGGQIHTSTDSGVTWTARNSARNWFGVASSADGLKLVACVNGGQIYTSVA